MGRCIVAGGKPDMAAPVAGILLSSIAEGSIVKLNENGSPVEFYVAKHDYESALNGTGRTLLVRKDCYDARKWHSSNVNAYATSTIDTWLNGTYKALFEDDVQGAIGYTKFYYTPGNGNTTISTLQRGIFLLSLREVAGIYGVTSSGEYCNSEGEALPIYETLLRATYGGSNVNQWTRTPYNSDNQKAIYVYYGGDNGAGDCNSTDNYSRPCFTLPSTSKFDAETMLFLGV